MSKPTPKQKVESKFGTRADLVSAIIGLIGDDGDTRSRLMSTTNKKLLRIHEVATIVKDRFGGKSDLIDAIEKFDPERGFKFETYAIARIKGAILDELRSIDWVPRSVRSKARKLEQAMAKLEAEHSRAATDAELAEEMGITEKQLRTMLSQISFVGVAALDEMLSVGDQGEGISLGDTVADQRAGPTDAFEVEEMRQILAASINRMPEREKIVLTLYYYEGLTLAEIGRVLGVTESRVCQIHTKAILHLRSKMLAAERDVA